MPRYTNILRVLCVLLFVGLLAALLYQQFNRDPYASEFAEVSQLVRRAYVEELDDRELFEQAMRGMAAQLDPYSDYISPASLQKKQAALDSEYAGVGMQVDKRSLQGPLIVLSPYFDAPAYRAGVKAGDRILDIDGVSTRGMPRSEAVMRIRGQEGEAVRLGLQHAGEQSRSEVVLAREPLVSHSLIGDTRRPDGTWDFRLPQHSQIAYVRLVSFRKHTAQELQAALADLDESSELAGVILDLRNNAGGYLRAAVAICDLFLADGVVVTFRDRAGVILEQHKASPELAVAQRVPLAILVNKYSASSSEVVAACLQDHQRAVVIGERTWGKGSVQKLFDLKSGGALKLTVATYWRPSGVNIHRGSKDGEEQTWGVVPDEGYEVSVSDEEHRRVFQERRWRSVPAIDTPDAADSADEPHSDSAPPPVDRVRLRAVEYLQSGSS